ncbi:MAG: methylmalonyl-CoA mutase family protein [bacterium]
MNNEISNVKLEKELHLKDDFTPPTYEQWKQVVINDLKGADFDKKLITKTYENISLNPIYTKLDLENLTFTDNLPGFENYVRGSKSSGYLNDGWQISQQLNTPDAEIFNNTIKLELERGLNSISFAIDLASQKGLDADYAKAEEVGKNGLSISGLNSLTRALKGLDITKYPVHVFTGFSSFPFLMLFAAYCKNENIDSTKVCGSVYANPIGFMLLNGKMPISVEKALNELQLSIELAKKYFPNIKVINSCGFSFNSAGANAVQELAFTFAGVVEYVNALVLRGMAVEDIFNQIRVNFGISSFYFMEIAKLRAAKLLWSNLVKAYGLEPEKYKLFIHARTSAYNQTKYDPYVNMLRTTTEAFSAVVGGIDSLHTNAFDEEFNISDELSRRTARNTQIILKEESQLAKLIDPAGGSYFVEKLTDEVAASSWSLLQEVENQGGMFAAIQNNFVQNEIEKSSDLRKADLAKRKSVLVGTNMYANVKETLPEQKTFDKAAFIKKRAEYLQKFRVSGTNKKNSAIIEKLYKLVDSKSTELFETGISAFVEGATLGELSNSLHAGTEESISINPLKIYKLAGIFEELRDITENFKKENGSLPKLFLATMGPVKQHKGRADFARGFFEVAGFDVIYPNSLNTTADAVEALIKSEAKVVVLCSTDDTYPEIVPAFMSELKSINSEILVVLAGYPKEQIEAHKEAGISEFIYLGCDAYLLLKRVLNKTIELSTK